MSTETPPGKRITAALRDELGEMGRDPEFTLPVLQRLQSHGCRLDRHTSAEVADVMGWPASRIEGVRSFYTMLKRPDSGVHVLACDGIACWMKGSEACRHELDQAAHSDPHLHVERSSCLGLCDRAPAILVDGQPDGPFAGWPTDPINGPPLRPALPGETRFILERCGRIDPSSIDDALAARAWQGLQRALGMSRDGVIAELQAAGLRGRGGAGYPTARKWKQVADTPAAEKFVIANADESEPLMFKDRVLMESDPQALLEGMAIAAYAVGANRGYVYVRGEYETQARLLEHAIEQAVEAGWLGPSIQDSEFAFEIEVHRGAGAYICGEESALIESLEGRRGEPRLRPPYPAQSGLRGMPTVVNNVETLVTCAAILGAGSDRYRQLGRPDSPGTRLFTLLGHINTPGLIEIPLGLSLRTLIDDFGGGLAGGEPFQFALTGGAAGSIVGPDLLDVAIDHDSWRQGVTMGSGGILICDQSVSPVAVVYQLLRFFEAESCGKCTPCRAGTVKARMILERLLAGRGTRQDIIELERTATLLKEASFCGLGSSAADPILSSLNQFRSLFEGLVS